MIKKIITTIAILLIASCINKPSYLKIDPQLQFKKTTIGQYQKIKLNFIKIDEIDPKYEISQLGYKVRENVFYDRNQSAIYTTNLNVADAVQKEFSNWLLSNQFQIVSGNNFDKIINVKLAYYSIQPINGAFLVNPKIKFAIKIEVKNQSQSFAKWYFFEKQYDHLISNQEKNQDAANSAVKSLLKQIFTDKKLLNLITK